jgi:2-phospho-L-lactate/phosphoenolpyruvate guanylyltransferase
MTVAVVPAKDLGNVKGRLGALLTLEERRTLFLAMLADVLDALARTPALGGVLVVTHEPEVKALARRFSAEVLEEDENLGHTAAVLRGIRELSERGVPAMLTVPGDVPALSPEEIAAMLDALGAREGAVLVPSRDRRGTNGVLLRPPGVLPLRFGEPSFEAHVAKAVELGIPARILQLPGLGLDIDTPDDVAAFLSAPSATRTYEHLVERRIAERLRAPVADAR